MSDCSGKHELRFSEAHRFPDKDIVVLEMTVQRLDHAVVPGLSLAYRLERYSEQHPSLNAVDVNWLPPSVFRRRSFALPEGNVLITASSTTANASGAPHETRKSQARMSLVHESSISMNEQPPQSVVPMYVIPVYHLTSGTSEIRFHV